MKTQDGRKLSPKTLEEFRIRAIQRVQAGESPETVIKTLGFSRACIYNWLARYRAGGWYALKTGSRTGRPKKLGGKQIAWIYKTVVDKDPLQMKFNFALWTRSMVSIMIKRKYGIKLSESSVGRLLRQLGLSCQKPLYRAYQQNPDIVKQWKDKVFPEIKKRAKKVGATIYFQDESGIRSDFHSGKTWAVKGQTPVIKATGARFSLNMVGAISTRGQFRFMVVKGSVASEKICDFLDRLMHNAEKPIFLIWDGHPTHRSKKVKEHIASFDGKLEVYVLPSYSPELNPIEQAWNNVKGHGIGRKIVCGSLKSSSCVKFRNRINIPCYF
jgi:transposase